MPLLRGEAPGGPGRDGGLESCLRRQLVHAPGPFESCVRRQLGVDRALDDRGFVLRSNANDRATVHFGRGEDVGLAHVPERLPVRRMHGGMLDAIQLRPHECVARARGGERS